MNDQTVQWMLNQYEQLEPGQSDSWNPLRSDVQLEYRLALFFALTRALRSTNAETASLSVLDFGCGNGRSTRMYVDLGFAPEQITGVDIRGPALRLAQRLHPAIHYRVVDDHLNPLADESFDWISVCTVMSSVPAAGRQPLFERVARCLRPGGHLFYFDLWRANDFAGADRIDVRRLLPGLEVAWWTPLRSQSCLPRVRPAHGRQRRMGSPFQSLIRGARRVRRMLRPSYEVMLALKHANRSADARMSLAGAARHTESRSSA
jgi:SAM-dependent methyltransferase